MKDAKQLRADLLLLAVVTSWGLSYIANDICLECMEPLFINAVRFLGAFVVAVMFSVKRVFHANKDTIKYGAIMGAILCLVYIGSTYGIKCTTQSNCAFLVSMTAIFVPIFSWCIFKEKLSKKTVLCVALCFIGMCLFVLKPDFSINMDTLTGDLWSIQCAITYAFHIIFMGKFVRREGVDAYALGVIQLGFCGVFSLILSLALSSQTFPQTGPQWIALAFIVIFCSGVAFICQPIAQQHTTPEHTALIFALEPVIASVVAYFFNDEVLTPRGYIGAVMMLLAVVFMEVDFKKDSPS